MNGQDGGEVPDERAKRLAGIRELQHVGPDAPAFWLAMQVPFLITEIDAAREDFRHAVSDLSNAVAERDEARAQCAAMREALEEVRPRCEQCGEPGTRRFRTEGDGPYWLCDSEEADHGEEFYCGDEVELPKLRAALASDAGRAYEKRIRAQERERCAKVAESEARRLSELDNPQNRMAVEASAVSLEKLAARIRALGEGT